METKGNKKRNEKPENSSLEAFQKQRKTKDEPKTKSNPQKEEQQEEKTVTSPQKSFNEQQANNANLKINESKQEQTSNVQSKNEPEFVQSSNGVNEYKSSEQRNIHHFIPFEKLSKEVLLQCFEFNSNRDMKSKNKNKEEKKKTSSPATVIWANFNYKKLTQILPDYFKDSEISNSIGNKICIRTPYLRCSPNKEDGTFYQRFENEKTNSVNYKLYLSYWSPKDPEEIERFQKWCINDFKPAIILYLQQNASKLGLKKQPNDQNVKISLFEVPEETIKSESNENKDVPLAASCKITLATKNPDKNGELMIDIIDNNITKATNNEISKFTDVRVLADLSRITFLNDTYYCVWSTSSLQYDNTNKQKYMESIKKKEKSENETLAAYSN